MIRPRPPSTSWRRSISRITSLALTQSGSSPTTRTPQIAGICRYRASPANGERHFYPAGAEREHAERAGRRRMAVGADQRLAGFPEALHVDGVAHAVAGAAVPDTEALARAAQELVVVCVLVVLLQQIVIDVLRRELGPDPI
jgi:hypothetical protein